MGAGGSSENEKQDEVLHGFDRGYEELIAQYGGPVYRLCLNLTHDEAESEVMLSKVFQQAVSEIEQLTERQSSLNHSFLRLALEHVAEREQDKASASDMEIEPGETLACLDRSFAPSSPDLALLVQAAVQILPYEYRVVYTLREVLDLSVDETAEVFNISPLEARAYLHRARITVCREVQRQRERDTRDVSVESPSLPGCDDE